MPDKKMKDKGIMQEDLPIKIGNNFAVVTFPDGKTQLLTLSLLKNIVEKGLREFSVDTPDKIDTITRAFLDKIKNSNTRFSEIKSAICGGIGLIVGSIMPGSLAQITQMATTYSVGVGTSEILDRRDGINDEGINVNELIIETVREEFGEEGKSKVDRMLTKKEQITSIKEEDIPIGRGSIFFSGTENGQRVILTTNNLDNIVRERIRAAWENDTVIDVGEISRKIINKLKWIDRITSVTIEGVGVLGSSAIAFLPIPTQLKGPLFATVFAILSPKGKRFASSFFNIISKFVDINNYSISSILSPRVKKIVGSYSRKMTRESFDGDDGTINVDNIIDNIIQKALAEVDDEKIKNGNNKQIMRAWGYS